MPTELRPLTAEFLGTLLFVVVGAGSVVASVATGAGGAGIGPVGVALAHGVGMAVIISMTMSISGAHLNPAVTFGLWIADKIDAARAGRYVLAQFLGAIAGAALLKLLLPRTAVAFALLGTPHVGADVSFMQAVWIEAAFTFFLVSAVFGTAVSSEAPQIAGFGIGLAIFVAALVAGNWTGAVLNPARALGPALVAWQWSAHAVYWIGPLIGAGVAGALWKAILLPRT